MKKIEKLHHDMDFSDAADLRWYTGLYLGLPRVFMSVVRNKIVASPNVDAVVIPLYTVRDPVSGQAIHISITDRYFFLGTHLDLESEYDIGTENHIGTIMLLRNREDSYKPTRITVEEIRQVISSHVQKRRKTIQENVTVLITAGTFKDWYATVEEKPTVDSEMLRVRIESDEWQYVTPMPTALCKLAS